VHVRVANRPGDLAAMLGVWLAGGVVVPVHAAAASNTVRSVGQATGARLVVDREAIDTTAAAAPARRPLLDGAAFILFTSGTTGKPKGVVIGHAALVGKLDVLEQLLRIKAADTVLLPLQLTFVFGIWATLLALRSGAHLLLAAKFDISAGSALGETTVLPAVPSLLRTILAGPVPPAPRLRTVLTGGEALGPVLTRQIKAAWPLAQTYDLYGSTETGSCDFACYAGNGTEGSIGRPTTGVLYRVDDVIVDPATQAPSGELLIRTPFGMAGYLDDPALTEASFTGGYYRTGDLARALPDGSITLVGRLKEIISRGGNKIAPQEIDDLLSSHPAVAASLTSGLTHARLGEAIHSAVVLAAGHEVTPEALRLWLGERTERFKLPDSITIMDALPTGPTGKASRAALKEILITQLQA
jgi:long-chain acyl-CoA synthetase